MARTGCRLWEECEQYVHANGYCPMHLERIKRFGSPDPSNLRNMTTEGFCLIGWCGKPRRSRGYCGAHYQRLYRYGDPLGGPEPPRGLRRVQKKYRKAVTSVNAAAARRGAKGKVSGLALRDKFRYWGERCYLCKRDNVGVLEVDHVIPVSRGGQNLPANIRPICRTCNMFKGTRTLAEMKGGTEQDG